jgi:hypothetical protein
MRLENWLAEIGKTRAWLARELEVTPPTITGYCRRDYMPRGKRLAKIEFLSGGKVRARDFEKETAE